MANPSLTLPSPHDTMTDTRLHGRKLQLMQAMWVVIILLTLTLTLSGFSLRYEKVKAADPNIRQGEFRALIEAGAPAEVVAAYDVALGMLLFLVFSGVGLFIFWRKSDSWLTIVVSLALILLGVSWANFLSVHRTTDIPVYQPLPGLLATIMVWIQGSFSVTALYWLPDGRFVPHWTRFLVIAWVIIEAAFLMIVKYPESHNLVNYGFVPLCIIAVWSQVYRYRRVASPVHRQQIKWVMLGIVVTALGFLFYQTISLLIRNQEGSFWLIVGVITRVLAFNVSFAAAPVCIGIAILRYRIWDVDLALNRSLVYGVVTVLVAVVFLGGGFLLQGVLGLANAGIAFAISTIGAGLLFNPARKRVQHFIDRRFYGFRFDLDQLAAAQDLPEVKNPGLLTGRRLGPYHVLGVLGKGGMGEVYQGQGNGLTVAIKILPDDLAQQEAFRKRFEREAQTLATLDHPNIVKMYGSGESDGVSFMALEFIEGEELKTIIQRRSRIPINEIFPFARDFASALDYAHDRGLVHRDIKPSNIMLRLRANGENLEAVLMDFGIAKIQDARTELTGTGAVGTIDYVAPEQIMAARTVDRRADIYALGVVLFEMLTGERPFKGSAAQVLFAHLQQPPPDPRDILPELSEKAASAVLRAMAKKPEDRFQSAGELAAALVAS